jgi:hypothetical protein
MYRVWLSNNFRGDVFQVDMDLTLCGQELRNEFEEYYEKRKKEVKATRGAEALKQMMKSEEVKKYFLQKKIGLVEDRDTLKSAFILKKGEKKAIDDIAKESLEERYGRRNMVFGKGTEHEIKSSDLGFLEFEEMGAEDKVEDKLEPIKKDDGWHCPFCNEKKSTRLAVIGHMRTHEKDKDK